MKDPVSNSPATTSHSSEARTAAILRLAVTPGEPAGIGPDILIDLVQQGYPCELVAIASPELLLARAHQLNMPLTLRPWDPTVTPAPLSPGELVVCPVPLRGPVTAGQLNAANARYVLDTLDRAIQGCQNGDFAALITGPVHKGIINEAGIPFSGHTEYLADHTGTGQVVMMLATEGLRVALVTTHLPLARVPAAITPALLTRIIRILDGDLRRHFGIPAPRILVCGLNPHAGEGGHMGREEIEVIEPTLAQLRAGGINLIGPLPADTLFTPHHLADADAVLAMYHDQGLPVLKYKGFGQAVNITLGLPLIRTSVDHGTALDLAATGKADRGSLETALNYARQMATARAEATASP